MGSASSSILRCTTLKRSLSSVAKHHDVIVIGGGHAGCEAAHASARIGCSTLLITHKISTIGEMSCNPSFGGIGKGHLIREIDALDGLCGRVCDKSGIHFKMLNRSKGPAVWGHRAQMDRGLYKKHMQEEMLNCDNLSVMEGSVDDLIISNANLDEAPINDTTSCSCEGVILANGEKITSSCVVLTTGTFLRGQINIGLKRIPAGRKDDEPAIRLAETIENLGFEMGRLKTGTPPRILADTIDFRDLTVWNADSFPQPFSFMNDKVWIDADRQLPCFTVTTSAEVKSIVLNTLHLNAHVNEEINGPRYCPSIESKIMKFGDRTHLLWLEPEELDTRIVYLQGFSCTMPEEQQLQAVRSMKGLEKVVFSQPGYGVEYDFMDPRQITPALETKKVQSLFFAGQINGTTGYEEAAAQGIIAGINAARKALKKDLFFVSRSDSYIGVMIDDLTTFGTNEPYRMFTSRTEFRMSLRPDNADLRLTSRAYTEAGCISESRKIRTDSQLGLLNDAVEFLKTVKKNKADWKDLLCDKNISDSPNQFISAFDLIGGFNVIDTNLIFEMYPDELKPVLENRILRERVKTLSLYEKLVIRQEKEIQELRREESLLIPDSIDYTKLNIKSGICEKLERARPMNLAAASRIQGMTPAALLNVLAHIKRHAAV